MTDDHLRSPAKGLAHVFHEQDEVQIVGRARLELGDQVKIEGAGRRRLGVHQEAATADVLRQFEQACKDVLEEACAEPAALMCGVDTEASEQRHGLRVSAGALP